MRSPCTPFTNVYGVQNSLCSWRLGWLGRNHQNTPATNFKEHFGKVAAPCLGECIWNARYPPPCASARFRICGMGFIGILLPSNVSKFICNLVVHSTKPPTTCDRVVDSVDSPAALLNQRGEQSNVWVLWSLMYFDPRWGPPPAMQWWPKGFHRARPKLDDGWPESEKDVFQAALRMVVVKDSRWIVGEFYMAMERYGVKK